MRHEDARLDSIYDEVAATVVSLLKEMATLRSERDALREAKDAWRAKDAADLAAKHIVGEGLVVRNSDEVVRGRVAFRLAAGLVLHDDEGLHLF